MAKGISSEEACEISRLKHFNFNLKAGGRLEGSRVE